MKSPDTFVCVDLETTGLDPKLCEIIEIGAVKVENGRITAEFAELVKPSRPIPDFITHLTGITDEMPAATVPVIKIMVANLPASGSSSTTMVIASSTGFFARYNVPAAHAITAMLMINKLKDAKNVSIL